MCNLDYVNDRLRGLELQIRLNDFGKTYGWEINGKTIGPKIQESSIEAQARVVSCGTPRLKSDEL